MTEFCELVHPLRFPTRLQILQSNSVSCKLEYAPSGKLKTMNGWTPLVCPASLVLLFLGGAPFQDKTRGARADELA